MSNNDSVTAFDGGEINLACFDVGGRIYALDVTCVREIVRWQPVTPLPSAPELIDGVIDLREGVIPVIDLGHALGSSRSEPTSSSRIVVLEIDGLVFGLAVQAAVDVLSVAAAALEDPPALAVQAGYDAVRAVVRRPEMPPVMVLSLEHLLERVYRSALSAQGEVA